MAIPLWFFVLRTIFFHYEEYPAPQWQPNFTKTSEINQTTGTIRVPILVYHRISNYLFKNVLFVRPQVFREQMEYLRQNNYHVISYAQFYDAFINDTKLPDKPVVLTFDDGNKDLFNNAYPILHEYNYPAMFFVYTKSIDHLGGTMNWGMLREMLQNGMEIGSHTVNHSKLTQLKLERVHYELLESKKVLENNLFTTVNHFAYPYGLFNTSTEQAVSAAGYLSAAAVTGGAVHDRVRGPYEFVRLIATEDMGYFKWILEN